MDCLGKPGGHRFKVAPCVDLCSHKPLQLLSAHLQAQGARPNVTLASRQNSPMQMADVKGVERMVMRVDEALGEPWSK